MDWKYALKSKRSSYYFEEHTSAECLFKSIEYFKQILRNSLIIHEENTKEIMSVKESVYPDTKFCCFLINFILALHQIIKL